MRLFRIPYLLAFLLCLMLGRTAGSYIAQNEPRPGKSNGTMTAQFEQPQYINQNNFLVVKVDDLESDDPQLDVVWWLLHKDRVPLNLIPILPSLGNPIQDEILRQSFSLERTFRGIRLSPEFEGALIEEGIQWQAYVILDNLALGMLTGGVSLGDSQSETSGGGRSVDDHWMVSLLTSQWNDICQQTLKADWRTNSQGVVVDELIQSHLILGPDKAEFFTIWDQILADNPGLRCVFPTADPTESE